MDLSKFIVDIPATFKVNYAGAADLSAAYNFILNQGGEYIARFPRSLSIGIALPNAIVDLLPRHKDKGVRVSYYHHAYEVVNQRLDLTTSIIAAIIQEAGYQAFPIPASRAPRDERICGLFSHKLAAHLSGLGWIGKSCMLITPKNGPRVRWGTILTDAPLISTGQPLVDQCGDCTACVDICPVHAFTGKHFKPEEPREVRYHADKCDRYFKSMEAQGDLRVCGLCLYVCPFGKGEQKHK